MAKMDILAPLDRLLRAEVEVFGAQQVILAGPPLAIAVAHVQPLALVLHEVIANAVLHGALSMAAGTLTIDWRPDSEWTHIELQEAGGPTPANDRTSGLGMKIMDAIVQRQRRGTITFDWQFADNLFRTLDRVHDRVGDMVLIHGGDTQGHRPVRR